MKKKGMKSCEDVEGEEEEKEPLVIAQPVAAAADDDDYDDAYLSKIISRPSDIPDQWKSLLQMTPELWDTINSSEHWIIRQNFVAGLKTGCCDCPVPCAPHENRYTIYASVDTDKYIGVFTVQERSDDCNRCYCRPYHPLRLEITASRYANIGKKCTYNEVTEIVRRNRDTVRENRYEKFLLTKKTSPYGFDNDKNETVLSIIRDDGCRCCCDREKCYYGSYKCLCCCACCSVCMDGVRIYAGYLDDDPDGQIGRPYELPSNRFLASASQPCCGGCFLPQLVLRERDENTLEEKKEPFGSIVGPCLFGGFCDSFFDSFFSIIKYKSDEEKMSSTKSIDMGRIVKKASGKNDSWCYGLCDDVDLYEIDFSAIDNDYGHKEQVTITAVEKLTILSAHLLTDNRMFESYQKCDCACEGIWCKWWSCSCFGCILPCLIFIPCISKECFNICCGRFSRRRK